LGGSAGRHGCGKRISSPSLFLEQLVFLDDVEDTGIQFFNTSVTRAELLSFFEAHTRANADRL
jgi:hypothetical protein